MCSFVDVVCMLGLVMVVECVEMLEVLLELVCLGVGSV